MITSSGQQQQQPSKTLSGGSVSNESSYLNSNSAAINNSKSSSSLDMNNVSNAGGSQQSKNDVSASGSANISSSTGATTIANSATIMPSIQIPPTAIPIYIGNLSSEVNESNLHSFVASTGIPLISARICRNNETKKSLNYGYLNFHSQQEAEQAIKQLNYLLLNGRSVRMMQCQRDPTMRRSGKGNIIVKNLPKTVTHRLLYDTLSTIGTVQSISLKPDIANPQIQNACVQFDDEKLAEEAVSMLNNSKIEGSTMVVAQFKPQKEEFERQNMHEDTFVNCYVKNLPKHLIKTDEQLKSLFEKFGEITSCKLARDLGGNVTGAGYVCFKDHESAKLACEEGSKIMLEKVDQNSNSSDNNHQNEDHQDEEDSSKTSLAENSNASQLKPLMVCRFMRKNERSQVLKDKFENLKISSSSGDSAKLMSSQSSSGLESPTLSYSPPNHNSAAAAAGYHHCGSSSSIQNNVYIKNLHPSITDAILEEEFGKFGKIVSAKVMTMPQDDRISRGFGFVCFQDPNDAKQAIQAMHGTYFYSKPLHCEMAQKKAERMSNLRQQFKQQQQHHFPNSLSVAAANGFLGHQMPAAAFHHHHQAAAVAHQNHHFLQQQQSQHQNMMQQQHHHHHQNNSANNPSIGNNSTNQQLYHQNAAAAFAVQQQQQHQQQQHYHNLMKNQQHHQNMNYSMQNQQKNIAKNQSSNNSSSGGAGSGNNNAYFVAAAPQAGNFLNNGTGGSSTDSANYPHQNNSYFYHQQQQQQQRFASNNNQQQQLRNYQQQQQHHNYNSNAKQSQQHQQQQQQLGIQEKSEVAARFLERLSLGPKPEHSKYKALITGAIIEMKPALVKELIEYPDEKFYTTAEKILDHVQRQQQQQHHQQQQ